MYDFLNWNPNSKTNYMLQFLRVMQHSQYITTPTHQKYKPATSSSTHYHTIQPKSTQPLLGKNIGTKRSLDKEHHWMEFDTQQLSATYMWWISRKQVSTSTLSHLLPTLHYEEQLNPHKWPSKQHYDMSATMSWTHTTPLYKHEKDFQAMQAPWSKHTRQHIAPKNKHLQSKTCQCRIDHPWIAHYNKEFTICMLSPLKLEHSWHTRAISYHRRYGAHHLTNTLINQYCAFQNEIQG